jgi:hypothetical protein
MEAIAVTQVAVVKEQEQEEEFCELSPRKQRLPLPGWVLSLANRIWDLLESFHEVGRLPLKSLFACKLFPRCSCIEAEGVTFLACRSSLLGGSGSFSTLS